MSKATITIDPAKFTIYDSDLSECSDSDFDSDEWVSVTSSTSSTHSTLPKHLVLRPRSKNVKAPPPLTSPDSYHSTKDLASTITEPDTFDDSHIAGKLPTLIVDLKSLLPTLTAIYLVFPASVRGRSRFPNENSSDRPFSTFQSLPVAPPIHLHTPSKTESYLSLCMDCAKPSTSLFCDGTWSSKLISDSLCPKHAMQTVCEPEESPAMGSGHTEHKQRDQELLRLVLEVVRRSNEEEMKQIGLRIFDMTTGRYGQQRQDVYAHREDCGCKRR